MRAANHAPQGMNGWDMSDDPLHKPLKPRSWRERLRWRPDAVSLLAALFVLALAGAGVWAWLAPPPTPAPVTVERELPPRPQTTPPPSRVAVVRDARPAPQAPPTAKRQRQPNGVRIIDVSKLPAAPSPEIGKDMPTADSQALPKAPFPDLVEKSSFGPLPKRGRKGRAPWLAYARPVPPAVLKSSRPKLAVIVADLGLNRKLTDEATLFLPPEVTLAFVPRAPDLKAQTGKARQQGHEFLLQVPMEPWGLSSDAAQPDMLLTTLPPQENLRRLRRILARAPGHVGILTYAGQKFLKTGEALSPVLHELKKRGLLAVDDGATADSLLSSLGLVVGAPVLRADVRILLETKEAPIRARLEEARKLAMRQGHALLVVSVGRAALNVLETWLTAMQNDDTGPLLVPASALARMKAGK